MKKNIGFIPLDSSLAAWLLEKLSKKTTLGSITNGPSEHQRDKVRALGLERWIPMERNCAPASGICSTGKSILCC